MAPRTIHGAQDLALSTPLTIATWSVCEFAEIFTAPWQKWPDRSESRSTASAPLLKTSSIASPSNYTKASISTKRNAKYGRNVADGCCADTVLDPTKQCSSATRNSSVLSKRSTRCCLLDFREPREKGRVVFRKQKWAGVMLWAGFSTRLVFVENDIKINVNNYIRNILETKMLP